MDGSFLEVMASYEQCCELITLWFIFRVVTCGDNGEIKLWNYSNGQCIRILDKGTLCTYETSD